MECANNSEREANMNIVEQLENNVVNIEYISTQKSSKRQRQSKGKVFSCEECEFTGSQTGLRLHTESKHVGVRYSCDQCEFVATRV